MKPMPHKDELESLQHMHHTLERELQSITRHHYLTPHEQQRARILKKEKLKAKDKMRVVVTKARQA